MHMAHSGGSATLSLRGSLMTTDPEPDPSGRLPDQGEHSEPLEDIIEALTALGNYLSVAHHIIAEGSDLKQQQIVKKALEKAVEQHERSISALRLLCKY